MSFALVVFSVLLFAVSCGMAITTLPHESARWWVVVAFAALILFLCFV